MKETVGSVPPRIFTLIFKSSSLFLVSFSSHFCIKEPHHYSSDIFIFILHRDVTRVLHRTTAFFFFFFFFYYAIKSQTGTRRPLFEKYKKIPRKIKPLTVDHPRDRKKSVLESIVLYMTSSRRMSLNEGSESSPTIDTWNDLVLLHFIRGSKLC